MIHLFCFVFVLFVVVVVVNAVCSSFLVFFLGGEAHCFFCFVLFVFF